MDTKIVELNTDIYKQLSSIKKLNSTYSDLIIDLINDDYEYNEIKTLFINNVSEKLAISVYESIGLDFITHVFDKDVRCAISYNIPGIIDDYQSILVEREERSKIRTLNQNTKNIEIELFVFNKLFELAMDNKTVNDLIYDIEDDYNGNNKYYTLNHIIIRSMNNVIEMLIKHKENKTLFEDKILETISNSKEFAYIFRDEIGLKKIKRLFNESIYTMLESLD